MTLDVEIPPVAIGWTLALVAEESYAHASFIVPVNAMGSVIIADISEPIELPPPWLYPSSDIICWFSSGKTPNVLHIATGNRHRGRPKISTVRCTSYANSRNFGKRYRKRYLY